MSIQLSDFEKKEFKDISGQEVWREYVFPGGATVRVDHPRFLLVKAKLNGDSHKLVDATGVRHYIPAGWVSFRFNGTWAF